MPLRKKVIAASYSAASERNRGNSPVSRFAAPSQEKTTNCGGVCPGSSRWGTGWCGWGPVSAVDPSPMSRPVLSLLSAAGSYLVKPRPSPIPSSATDAYSRNSRRDNPLMWPSPSAWHRVRMPSPTGLERHPPVGRDRHHQRGQLLVDEAVAGPSFTRSEDQPVVTRRASERLSANPVTRCPHRDGLFMDACRPRRLGTRPGTRSPGQPAGHGHDPGEADHRLGVLGPGLVVAHAAGVLADPGQGACHYPAAGDDLEAGQVIGALDDADGEREHRLRPAHQASGV